MPPKRSLVVTPSPEDVQTEPLAKRARPPPKAVVSESPRRRAFARECKYEKGEKVIGFYGGWPYIGSVSGIESVRMSFGLTYMIQIRWNGFSGKNAVGWVSEFDIVKHNEAGLKLKADMEETQRELMKQAGTKVDKVKHRKIFLRVVSQFRGKRLAPFPPQTAPYPDEWQTIVRITAMPKALVDHLKASENLISERRLVLAGDGIPTAGSALTAWAGDNEQHQEYRGCVTELFRTYLMKVLVYRFEIPFIAKCLAETCQDSTDYTKVLPVEYLVRLLNSLPQLLTAATQGILMGGAASGAISSLVQFVNSHQSFMTYLVDNIEPLLRGPVRRATVEGTVPEGHWNDCFVQDSAPPGYLAEDIDTAEQGSVDPAVPSVDAQSKGAKRIWRNKRKNPFPIRK